MNGLMLDPRGRLIGCQSTAGRIVAIDLMTKSISEIASQFEGTRFNSPNDLVVDRAGNIYFTDRNGNGVFFITTDNSVKKIISNLTLPNGILLSIDEKTLYVLHGSPTMMAYSLSTPGMLGTPQTITLAGNGGGDGMTIDIQGESLCHPPVQQCRSSVDACRPIARHFPPCQSSFQLRIRRGRYEDIVRHCPHFGLHGANDFHRSPLRLLLRFQPPAFHVRRWRQRQLRLCSATD